jgi:hypothetical protein
MPAVEIYMVNYMMIIATQIFSDHIRNLELSIVSLGNTRIQVFSYGLMVYSNQPNLLIKILISLLRMEKELLVQFIYLLSPTNRRSESGIFIFGNRWVWGASWRLYANRPRK